MTLRGVVKQWAAESYERVVKAIERNIAGGVLHAKPSGPLFKSIRRVSILEDDGFAVGTDIPYGIAWEDGFSRKMYAVNPVKRKCLHWIDKGGKSVFAKYSFIPAQTFPARPFMRPALEENQDWMDNRLAELMNEAMGVRLQIFLE